MAKIDVTSIEGYAEMTAEEKLAALEGYEFETPAPKSDEEVAKLKTALSNANSDAAEWKKKYRQGLDEAKRLEEERKEREQAVESELQALRRDKAVSGYVAQCLALGYTQDLATRAAEAMADGNTTEIFACQQAFLEAKQKEIEANALNRQPTLTAGAPPTAKTAEAEAYNNMRKAWGLKPIPTK